MKVMHWSQIYVNYISIEMDYDDGGRQGWEYDCSHFATIQDLEMNMAADFNLPLAGVVTDCALFITHNDEHFTIDVGIPEYEDGEDFAAKIMQIVGETLEWQPAVIS